jgi:hypothetical protein
MDALATDVRLKPDATRLRSQAGRYTDARLQPDVAVVIKIG